MAPVPAFVGSDTVKYSSLDTLEEGSENSDNWEDEFEEEAKQRNEKEKTSTRNILIMLGSVAGFGINLAVALTISGLAPLIASVVGMSVALGVGVRQRGVDNVNTLRDAQNLLRKVANSFAYENSRLGKEVDDLQVKVFCLKESEARLKEVADKQSVQVDSIKRLVKESQEIIEKKNEAIRDDIRTQMIATTIASDFDQSGTLSKKEVSRLISLLHAIPGVSVQEEKLRSRIRRDSNMLDVIEVIHKTFDHEIKRRSQEIFTIKEDSYAALED